MAERQFAGMLNSKMYGRNYGSNSTLLFKKAARLYQIQQYSNLPLKWNRKERVYFPSWSKSLICMFNCIEWTQRQSNIGCRKRDKKIKFFRWRK